MSLGNKSSFKIGVAVVALAGAVLAVYFQMRPVAEPQAYYYDLATGLVFEAADSSMPVVAPSGTPGVRAQVVSCGECKPSQWQVVSIHSYTPQASQILHGPQPDPEDTAHFKAWQNAQKLGAVIALPPKPGQQPQWITVEQYAAAAANDPLATTIRESVSQACDDGRQPHLCNPND